MAKKSLVYGVGINDADYPIRPLIDGKRVFCPIYHTWAKMLERCYTKYNHISSTYAECSVVPEWHTFSNFREWYLQQGDVTGKALDKDILYPGNKVYGPDTCVFVEPALNNLFCRKSVGQYPTGVICKRTPGLTKKYGASLTINHKYVSAGYHYTAEEAHKAYLKKKIECIENYYLNKESNPKIIDGLNRWIEVMRNGKYDYV